MNKVLLLIAMLLACAPGFAEPDGLLRSFDELMRTLNEGGEVRLVIDYGDCEMIVAGKPEKAPRATGGMLVDVFEYFDKNAVNNPKAFVVFSKTAIINHPRRGVVYNYAKIKIFGDNSVEINVQYLKPVTYKVIMDELFRTTIFDGTNTGAIRLYKD